MKKSVALSSHDIEHLASLANLTLSHQERKQFVSQLSETIKAVNKLQQIKVKNLAPTSQVTGLTDVTRPDKTSPSLSQSQAQKNSQKNYRGYFRVSAILDQS